MFGSEHPSYACYEEADLASMSTLYACYVRASGMRVPKGRGDLFAGWVSARRHEFLNSGGHYGAGPAFETWLAARHPAAPGSGPAR